MAEVIKNEKVGPGYYRLLLRASTISRKIKAGQFVHLKIQEQKEVYDPLLRRPFSIFDRCRQKGTISLVYRVVGRGTKILKTKKPGTVVDVLGPLGNGFTTEIFNKNVILLGGGAGIAPLILLAGELESNNYLQVMIGTGKSEEISFFKEQLSEITTAVKTATIDGSEGYRGTVVELLQQELSGNDRDGDCEIDYLYTCGPEPMLQSVQEYAVARNIQGEVSLEERMGCGTGVCLSCVCETTVGNQRVCKEGPVFSLGEVIFDERA